MAKRREVKTRHVENDQPIHKVPPFLNLDEALKVAYEIYAKGGGQLSYEDLSDIIDNKVTSSWFQMKVLALKAYGLISEPRKQIVELTPLATPIVAPQSPEELAEAKLKALTSYRPFRLMAERYHGKPEPPREFLENTFERELKIPADKKSKWADCFLASAKAADLFKTTLKINLQSKVGIEDKPLKVDTIDEDQRQSLNRELSAEEKKAGWLTYEVPVSGNARPRIIIPAGLKRKDFEKMKKVLEALAPEEDEDKLFKEG